MQPIHRPVYLAAQYLKNELTDREKTELEGWLAASSENRLLFEKFIDEERLSEQIEAMQSVNQEELWSRIQAEVGGVAVEKRIIPRWPKYIAAAIILCVALTTFYTFRHSSGKGTVQMDKAIAKKQDLPPGQTGAVLKLADGSSIVLDTVATGNLAVQGNTKLFKQADGQLVYKAGDQTETYKTLYNTLSTPRGRKIKVILPDQTQVWLNAASSLSYPTAFTGPERRVEITGEAYFEVAKNPNLPFIVHMNRKEGAGADVLVLGTHFNINAYEDENRLVATLLEGSIQFSSSGSRSVLQPGQEIQLSDKGAVQFVKEVNTSLTVAWKNEKFSFQNADIKTIMREVSRWYDVDVQYEGDITKTHYDCQLSRNFPVSKVFQTLENTGGVHFEINGKTVKVLP